MIVYDQNFIVLVFYTAVDGFTFPSDWKKIRQSMLERRLEENNVSNLPPLHMLSPLAPDPIRVQSCV